MKASDDYDINNDDDVDDDNDDVENDDIDDDDDNDDDDGQKWQSTTNFYLNVHKRYVK